ncbi:phosphatidate cytidylyltransferase [Oceanicola granulosus HTCC2516]|uniref:Phosphatidate cytidylyltransferase n=1 Tax=Oceanicola granulosus (strain ATCC BAA-861 / DSM 15982 / KCTC 12143 / HTCC2516) TaxID=314256 RepID=Q2CBN1_OCEGH|nr:phosphatidate cytidylyltransferase [Oceanicola granulosus]EAR50100.1 phosphatidate cytidylyltransferase [Oceanicola granulosus HTCC2516]
MSETDGDILLLSLGVAGLLMALTFFGEVLRARQPEGATDPAVETYMMRIHSWWAMVILLALALLIGFPAVLALFAFASFAALREFLTYANKRQADHLSLALAFFAVLPLQYVFVGIRHEGLFGTFIPVYAFLLLPVVSALRGDPEAFLVRVAETQWGLMTAVYCASHVPALMILDIPGYGQRGPLLIVFFVMVVQVGDLVEYAAGRRIGRRTIAPGLSPKTWEGVAAGLASAALLGGGLAWISPFGLFGAMAMAAAAFAAGTAGNLVFTAIKRDRGVKDWSHLIPGQGGFMEQLDSVIFAAPVFFHLTGAIWAV